MAKINIKDPSNATRYENPAIQNPINTPTAPLSNTGTNAVDAVLMEIYVNDYFIRDDGKVGSGDYLVYSAELKCSHGIGVGSYLTLAETKDVYNNNIIGHGANINGLPQAVKSDAKAGVNIQSFGNCGLLQYESKDSMLALMRTYTALGFRTSCEFFRKFSAAWTTPDESNLMRVGRVNAITTDSFLLCNPEKLTGYKAKGILCGKIQAVDSGQGNLDRLIAEYVKNYKSALIGNPATLFTNFTAQQISEFVKLYEVRYPERARAFENFYRNISSNSQPPGSIAGGRALGEYMLEIKCMTYMLDDKYARKMAELMAITDGLYVNVNFEEYQKDASGNVLLDASGNPKEVNAFFSYKDNTPYIEYPRIHVAETYKPPYKSFFHEFGHAIDRLAGNAGMRYSDTKQFQLNVEEYSMQINQATGLCQLVRTKVLRSYTIHGWARFDVRNTLHEEAEKLIVSYTGLKETEKIIVVDNVTENVFLKWNVVRPDPNNSNKMIVDSAALFSTAFAGEEGNLYLDIQYKVNQLIADVKGIANLAKDIYGGITGNQIGGGHAIDYWFDIIANVGDRITEVSGEAFAGYYEYIVLELKDGFSNINVVLPNFERALGIMLQVVI